MAAAQGTKQQLWKTNDARAQKTGPHRAVFWVQPTRQQPQQGPSLRDGGGGASAAQGSGMRRPESYTTGVVYTGEWQDDKKHGEGVQTWASGNKYEGQWARGARHGHGTLWVAEPGGLRRAYVGHWENDAKQGPGTCFYRNGDQYDGEFRAGVRHGRGRMQYVNGDVYDGEWESDKRSGHGTLTYANGNVYNGSFLHDKKEGAGRFFFLAKCTVFSGEWADDVARCGSYAAGTLDDAAAPQGADSKPLPELALREPDAVLARRVAEIRAERATVRGAASATETDGEEEERSEDVRAVFDELDDGTGCISTEQLAALLERLELPSDEHSLARALAASASGPLRWTAVARAVRTLRDAPAE